MQFVLEQLPIRVGAGAPLNIVDGKGTSLRVLRGRVWITQENSVDDVFLSAGDSHVFDRDGKAIVSAEGSHRATAVVTFDTPVSVRSTVSFASLLARLLPRWSSNGSPRTLAA